MATSDETAALAAAEAAKARKFKRSMKAMKSAVLEVQLILYEGVNTDEQLHAAGEILAQSEYGDVVEERYIAKMCGYARCANSLPAETRKGRYRISLSAKKVYDLQESRHFCSPACLIASKDFGNKLPLQRDLVNSTERLMEILGLVRGSQYTARSNSVKENDMRKPPARPMNVKRGKVRPKVARNAHPASSDQNRSSVEGRGQLESAIVSPNLSTLPRDSMLENSDHVASSGLNKGSLITPQVEQSNSTASNPSSSFQSVLVLPLTSESDGKATDTNIKSSSNGQKLRPENYSLSSPSISSTVQTRFEKLLIQDRVGDQTVLPIFDYGGPSDAIEGYVPSRSRREAVSRAEPRTHSRGFESTNSSDVASSSGQQEDQRLKIGAEMKDTGTVASAVVREEVQRSENSSRSQQKRTSVFKEWEGLVSGSPQAGPAKMCITEVDGEASYSESATEWNAGDSAASSSSSSSKSKDFQGKAANLKPALKKQSKVKQNTRSVAWADQNKFSAAPDIGKAESKERASSANTDETPNFEKGSEDVVRLEEKIKSMKLEEQQRSQTRLSESTLDLAMAARLASAEAIATALTEAAASASAGEVDGSEAVVQAGISILSATHNANPARSDSPHEAQDQSGETLESMKNSALDEDELFARAAQAREEMRRLKMPRKYGEIKEEEGFENGDVIDDLKFMANEDDADADDEGVADDGDDDDADAEEDDYYDDDSGGFEGAREVGFTAPPKGFKAEVSMFGTMIMAVEAWVSAAAVAHIYGKEPHQEDGYLSVNGREYSRYTVIGDGVSAEILRTFSLCVSRALPEVVRALRISVPSSTLELSLGRLIKTMSFVEALPPFGTKQWRMLVILLLDALSIHRVPRLGVHFSNNRTMLQQALDSTGTSEAEYDVFRDVVLPLGRSPTFATRSGG